VDILINNAGQGNYKSLVDTSIEEYDELMQSNMRSSFLFTRAVVPHFIVQRSGVLVFVSSVAGLAGAANEAVYSASKFAQVGFAQSLDHELRPHGIKVSTLCPGGMKTEFAVGRGRTATDVESSRMMEASDFADSIVFVCMQPANVRLPLLTVRHMG
jgi:short-subunit dehydrogenase